MPRFFVSLNQIRGDSVLIEGDDVTHISRVLRMKPGDVITVCDGIGTCYSCVISAIQKTSVLASVQEILQNETEPECKVTLYQGVPKGSKLDYIVQKCVEIGVHKIVPMETERVVAKGEVKTERLSRIALEAAKQSGRGVVPQIGETLSFSEAISKSMGTFSIIPYECEKDKSLKSVLRNCNEREISVFIGPEGGFSDAEITFAIENGLQSVTLGNRILRTETAGLVTIGNILYELEG